MTRYIYAWVILGLMAFNSVASASITSTFDAGLDGWTGSGGSVSFVSTGGNPGGFLQQTDTVGTFMRVIAPQAYLGDLSGFLQGTISFDAINLNSALANLTGSPQFGTVIFTGSAGTSERTLAGVGFPAPAAGWTTFSADLDPTLWSGDQAAVLSDVTSLEITLESSSTINEVNGLDNVSVQPIPEPQAIVSAVSGLIGLAWLARRQIR